MRMHMGRGRDGDAKMDAYKDACRKGEGCL